MVERLRKAFKTRYYTFRRLLKANNEALAMMTEIEEALRGGRPFGMSFVRERCTRTAANVFQIVKHMNELAPRKYAKLYDRFKDIQQNINPHIRPLKFTAQGPMVIPLDQIDKTHADLVGAKMANLGQIRNRIGMPTPDGFVISSQAYRRFIEHSELQVEIDRKIQAASVDRLDKRFALSSEIQKLIIDAPIPEELENEVMEHYFRLDRACADELTLAVRSSSLGEDLDTASFAGQFRSILDVNKDDLLYAYKEIIASKYSFPAVSYRLNRGLRADSLAMCVGCLVMVDARFGGVAYTRNPVNISDDSILIQYTQGVPKAVVAGRGLVDTIRIARGDSPKIQFRETADQQSQKPLHDDINQENQESLADDQALELANLALRLEEYYSLPLDIEWAIDKCGSLVILQCRTLRQIEKGKAESFPAPIEEPDSDALLRGGKTASSGVAFGPVFHVDKEKDLFTFPENAVLVARQALPRWALLLDRAAAVVTEQGSVASHLANVCREFQVPALFGLKGAFDTLKSGQSITVDANGLSLYDGQKEKLLEDQITTKPLMLGTDVYQALDGAAKHIVPLTLLDPEALSFRPESCKTFHDITRFCHEKSVSEMFSFGKDNRFPERSGKQLVSKVPMDWWILNLDDGFADEVDGKRVHLSNIVSVPMLALWEGITMFPWEGPPIDGKGFMSVMFQATANRSLVPGALSSYGDKNYFMISKNYCSLSSRLGFHFSTVEALVSDRSTENYLNFHFKGGAANRARKVARVRFIRDLLQERGFRVKIKEDHLIARVEQQPQETMISLLKVLGYMLIHTRQLDMIMSNETSVAHYRSAMDERIDQIMGLAGGKDG